MLAGHRPLDGARTRIARRTLRRRFGWSRLLCATVLFSVLPPALALAQPRALTLDEMRRELKPGDEVSLVLATDAPLKGRLLRIGDTDLDVRADRRQPSGERLKIAIPLASIRSLERPRDSVRNGTLIGAGAGAGVGVAMFVVAAAVDYNEIDEWAPAYLVGGAVATAAGALIGWAMDAARSKPHVRYDASPVAAARIRVVPVFSRGAGVAVVMSFR